MSAKMTISMIFLLCLVIFQTIQLNEVQSFRFPIHNVTSCPRNDIEWRKASDRLNCSLHFNKKVFRYHCLPDSKLTTLVEFCYDQLRPLVEKGNCVVLDGFNTLLDNYNCSEFKDGCPDKHYDSDAILKYPSCLKINTKNRCFIAEKKCTPFSGLDITAKSTLTRSASQRKEDTEIDKLCQSAIVVSTLFIISAIGLFIYMKHRRKTLHFRCLRNGENEENDPLIGHRESEILVKRRIYSGHLGVKSISDGYLQVPYGENICMTCIVVEQSKQEGNIEKKLNFIWKHKHGEEEYKIIDKDRDKEENPLTISNDPPIYALTIERAKKDDEGEYKLVLMNENEEKQDVATFKLDVLGCHRESEILVKRRIYSGHLGVKSISDGYLRVSYGENICMTSTVVEQNKQEGNAEKKLNFIWKHKHGKKEYTKIDEDRNKEENRFTISNDPPIYTLSIERAKKNHEGEYKLVLMNEKEEKQDVATFKLDVLGFEPLVKILGGARVYEGNTASFVVLQSSYPEAFRIKWFKVTLKPGCDVGETTECIDYSSDKYEGSTFDFLVINNASSEDQGRYVVEVENIIGKGKKMIDLRVEKKKVIDNGTDSNQLKKEEKEKPNQTEKIKIKEKKDIISISNVRRVYHISDAGSGNFWISDGGRLMKVDAQGYLIQLEDVGRFNTGCHSVNSKGELLYLKNENVFKCNESEAMIDRDKTENDTHKWMAWCIHCSSINNDILVGLIEKKGDKGRIHRYKEKDNKLEILGKALLSKPLYITENKNKDVIVSDAGYRAVIGMDSKGSRRRFNYEGDSPTKFFPTGVCTDKTSCILVCIYENNESNIHLLDEEGIFMKKILTKEDCATGPCAICIIGNNLYLGQESCQDIQVYQIAYEGNLHEKD